MHIALISAEYPPAPGGIGDYTHQLAMALIERGHRVAVIMGSAERRAQNVERRAQNSHPSSLIPHPSSLMIDTNWGWGAWRLIVRALREVRPDVVHIQYQTGAYRQHPAINLLPWRLRRLHIPVVVTAHDLRLPYLFPKADPVRHWITRRLLHDTVTVIVTNEEDLQRVTYGRFGDRDHYTDHLRAHLIPIGNNIPVAPPLGYNRTAWRQQLGLDDRHIVAYFGLMSETKGVDDAVHALAQLPPDVHLLIIGGAATNVAEQAYAAQVAALIATLGLGARVTYTGQCPAPNVSAHFLASDVAALPFTDSASYRRGSLLAALAHGLPVVTTTPHLPLDPPLVDGVHARLVPPHDPVALAHAIQAVLHDPDERRRLAEGGHTLAAYFAWPAIAATHEVVYNSISVKS